jgi:superfamily II DNA or RNA helicase
MNTIQTDKLRDYQIAPARHLLDVLSGAGRAVDLSDTGMGKTFTACSVLAAMDKPTLAVVPKSAIHGWREAAAHFGTHFDVLNYEMLRTGRTPYGVWEHPLPKEKATYSVCANCQCVIDGDSPPCYCAKDGEHDLIEHLVDHEYGKFMWHPGIDTLVFDEVHRCGAADSLQARMLIAARRDGKRVLCLSATAACSPLQMRALGYVLGLHTLTEHKDKHGSPFYATGLSFYQWAQRYGCRHTTWGGFQWLVSNEANQRSIMAEISGSLVPSCGVRICSNDVPNFPTRSIHCKLYDIAAADKIDKLYEQMSQPLAELQKRKEDDADPDNPLTAILRARQEVELLKVPVFDELTKDYLEKGNNVAVFVNFKETIDQLSRRLGDIPHAIIDGSPEHVRKRDGYIHSFEHDLFRVALVNVAAGSEAIGLRDLRGVFPRIGLVSPTFSARTMRQLFGRLPRDGSKSHSTYYVVFAADTVEEDICCSAGAKMDNVDALNDADLTPRNLLDARSKRRADKAAEKLS